MASRDLLLHLISRRNARDVMADSSRVDAASKATHRWCHVSSSSRVTYRSGKSGMLLLICILSSAPRVSSSAASLPCFEILAQLLANPKVC